MIKSQNDFINKIHLIISIIIVVPAAVVYGFKPDLFLEIHSNTIDENNFFKAIMGLYFGFATLWAIGIFNVKFLRVALISNVIFMTGLGLGRISSFLLDGTPSPEFVFGTIGELILGLYGIWVIYRMKT